MTFFDNDKPQRIPFRNIKGIILIDGEVNGIKGQFAFDTGATQTVFHQRRVGCGVENEKEAITFDEGTQNSQVSTIEKPSVKIGDIPVSMEHVFVMDMDYVESELKKEFPEVSFLGSLGHDLIAKGVIEIDYSKEQLTFNPELDVEDMIKVSFAMQQKLPTVRINVAGSEYTFILDTGANVLLFDAASAPMEELEEVEHKEGEPPMKLRKLSFAGMEYTDVPAVVSDISAIKAVIPEIQGIVGYPVLKERRSIFDFDHQTLYILKNISASSFLK